MILMNVPASPLTRASPRSFGALWAARDLAALGDCILLIGLLAWSYRVQESATVVGILVTARLLPPFLLKSAATRLAGGARILPVALVSQLLQGIALLPLLTVKSDDALPLVLVLVVALLAAIPAPFLQASQQAQLRALMRGDRLAAAEQAFANTRLIVLIVGPAAGTAFYLVSGLGGAAAAALVAFLVSLGLLVVAGPPPASENAAAPSPSASPAALQRGLIYALRYPPLRTVAVLRLLTALVAGGLLVAQVAFTVWGIFMGSEYVGLILAGQGLGMAGGSVARRPIDSRFPPNAMVATSLGLVASAGFAFTLSSSITFAVPFAAAMGFGFGLLIHSLDSLAAIHSPERLRSSVSAGLGMATEAAALLSAIAMGPLADLLTPRLAITLASVILSVLALYAFGAVADRAPSEARP